MIMSMYEYYVECSLMLRLCNLWQFKYYLFIVCFFSISSPLFTKLFSSKQEKNKHNE